ncbi:MAG TPA: hypothetical protein VMJ32_09185 [Pirellulales bacterium]|nr:hypothetical protein [Pirellulales bacterium]
MFKRVNSLIAENIPMVELMAVLMRIISFTLVAWMGPSSPFLFVWFFNTTDAILLIWCALLRKHQAYIVLNAFWILVGLIGILRAAGLLHS